MKRLLRVRKLGKIKYGDKFYQLTALAFDHIKHSIYKGKIARKSYWLFACDCGKTTIARVDSVKGGKIKSCGCLKTKKLRKRMTKHRKSNTRIYKIWQSMKQRCENENVERYNIYGGRGIKVCKRWLKFENFYADMGDPPNKKSCIDRKNTNGNYEKDNCHWTTKKENSQNMRSSRRWIIHGKFFKTCRNAADFNSVNKETIRYWCGLRNNNPVPLCYAPKIY